MNTIISLTSYPARYKTLHICLESLYKQDWPPNIIALYIFEKHTPLPDSVLQYCQKGLQIRYVTEDLKPHNKYYYALQEFKDDILITVDDDMIYPPYLTRKLLDSFARFPRAVSAGRVHGIKLQPNGDPMPYLKWDWESSKYEIPSYALMATGVGGVLYPPDCMPEEVFNKTAFMEYCPTQDDVWLKCMQLLKRTPVVLVRQPSQHPTGIPGVYTKGLFLENKLNGGTDQALHTVLNKYSIKLERIIKKDEQL